MARNEALPFPRGGFGTGYSDPSTVDATARQHICGMEWMHEDKDFSGVQRVAAERSNQFVIVRAMRNVSGGALLPKRVAKFNTGGATVDLVAGDIGGYAALGDRVAGVIDEFLPSTGVPNNEICWVTVQGPSKVTTDASGDTTISAGKFVIPGTSGTVVEQDVTVAAGSATFNQIQSRVGWALEAVAAINTDFLINVTRGF